MVQGNNNIPNNMPGWGIALLVIVVVIFVASVVFFSFIYPLRNKKKRINEQLKKDPSKVVVEPDDVRKFTSFDLNGNDDFEDYSKKSGVIGFYVNNKIENNDFVYPIYIEKSKDVQKGLTDLRTKLNNNEFKQLNDYLLKTNTNINKVRIFVIDDLNISGFSYWLEIFNHDNKGFNN